MKCDKCNEDKDQKMHRVTGYGLICEDCMKEIEDRTIKNDDREMRRG